MIDLASAKQIVLDFADTNFKEFITEFTIRINENFQNDIIERFFESTDAKDSRNKLDSSGKPAADTKWKRGRGGWSYSNGLVTVGIVLDYDGFSSRKPDAWWPNLFFKPNTDDKDINYRAARESLNYIYSPLTFEDDIFRVSTKINYERDYKITTYEIGWKSLSKRSKCPDKWSVLLSDYRSHVDSLIKKFNLDKEFDMAKYLEFVKACRNYK